MEDQWPGPFGHLSPRYDGLVPKNHPVRIVNSIYEGIDLGA